MQGSSASRVGVPPAPPSGHGAVVPWSPATLLASSAYPPPPSSQAAMVPWSPATLLQSSPAAPPWAPAPMPMTMGLRQSAASSEKPSFLNSPESADGADEGWLDIRCGCILVMLLICAGAIISGAVLLADTMHSSFSRATCTWWSVEGPFFENSGCACQSTTQACEACGFIWCEYVVTTSETERREFPVALEASAAGCLWCGAVDGPGPAGCSDQQRTAGCYLEERDGKQEISWTGQEQQRLLGAILLALAVFGLLGTSLQYLCGCCAGSNS